MEFGETAYNAIVREAEEELGIKVKPSFLFYDDSIDVIPGNHYLPLYFHAVSKAKPRLNLREASEYGYFSEQDIKDMDIAFDHKEVLQRFFREKNELL